MDLLDLVRIIRHIKVAGLNKDFDIRLGLTELKGTVI